jgi:membrane protease YdiL (CAAX protease family)
MATQPRAPNPWANLPTAVRAILSGLALALIATNVWPLFLLNLSVPLATIAETIFLALFLYWTAGGGPPRTTQAVRANSFRRTTLSPSQWFWAVLAAVFFAATIHASIVLLFRFVPFPTAAFRHGYNFSFIPSLPLKWLAVIVSAASSAICEEIGFRGYMQRPIEQRHGATTAILLSSIFFTLVHLTKGWATAGMVPIVFGAGILLGLLAWSSGSLIPGMIGHFIMDIGLFAYWWTGIAGDFTARPITQTGPDQPFLIACAVFAASLSIVLFSIQKLRRTASPISTNPASPAQIAAPAPSPAQTPDA